VTPGVSILIPAYNAEAWIADTLRSALAQTWQQKEIIVVDDGSTDRTVDIVRRFESDGVKVVTQKNQGAAAARNYAYSLSTGDYIQWLDADDLISPNKIADQMQAAKTYGSKRTLLSSAWAYFMYRPSRAKFTPTSLWQNLTPTEWLLRKMGENLHMQTGTWLVSRELTDVAGPWNTSLLGDDDGEYFCRILVASDGVHFVPEAKVYYRWAGTNSLSYIGRSNRKMETQWTSMKLHVDYLRSLEDSARVRAACVQYLQTYLINFYPERPDLVEQVQLTAKSLGEQLEIPRLSWKYSWIRRLFGWRLAKQARLVCPNVRWSLNRHWDRTLYRMQGRRVSPG
jgi:glycosyltransferase involved in cell wall biosynthesis